MKYIFALFLLSFLILSYAANKNSSQFAESYLGQNPPGETPVVFAEGILPDGIYHSTPVFTPDRNEIYWKMLKSNKISMMKKENDTWSSPQDIILSVDLDNFRDPILSPNGQKMFFLSKGKLPYQETEKENVWYVDRQEHGWSEPKPVNKSINSHTVHWQVSVASNGNLYFMSRDNNGFEDIYMAKYQDGDYVNPIRLPDEINSKNLCETTPFISPEEDFIIFSRWDLNDTTGTMHLFVSFTDIEGNWLPAKRIDTIDWGVCPQVTSDKKYFFFTGVEEGQTKIMWANITMIKNMKP